MRREKHITLKATLLSLICMGVGTYMFYSIDNLVELLVHSEVLKEIDPSMGIFLRDITLIGLILALILSVMTFGKNYEQMSFLNILLSYMLGYSFGTLAGLIRYYVFEEYYGSLGMRIVEVILIFLMFAVPHRLYSMKRYDVKEPKMPKNKAMKRL